MARLQVSVTIITFNESKSIRRCLESLDWADEIVVMDSHSTDNTVEICRQFTDKVFVEDWNGYGKQKNLCADKASYQWILNLDADEVVTPECSKEILQILAENPSQACYRFPRKNYFGDRWVQYAGWYPDRISRLYDKTLVSFSEVAVHEKLVPDAVSGLFHNPILHYSYQGTDDYVKRQNHYSTLFARECLNKGMEARWWDWTFRPGFAFLKSYIFKQGFREGWLGLFLAGASFYYTHLKYIKTRDPALDSSRQK